MGSINEKKKKSISSFNLESSFNMIVRILCQIVMHGQEKKKKKKLTAVSALSLLYIVSNFAQHMVSKQARTIILWLAINSVEVYHNSVTCY